MTFAELKKTGLVGCGQCYSVFEERLAPLLQRAHDGGARHSGKSPRRGGEVPRQVAETDAGDVAGVAVGDDDARTLLERVEALEAELAEAVSVEEYERAAEIRDRLRRLMETDEDDSGGAGSGPAEDRHGGDG